MLKLPQKIDNDKLSKFFDLETLGNITNAIPVIPGMNTVAGILLATNYARQEQFLNDVINERLNISQKEINKNEFLKRFYLTSQVIAKAQSQEKYNRFKKLLVNSTLYEISDNDYELFNRLIDELTDLEFLYLSLLVKNIDKKLNILNSEDDNRKLIAEYNKTQEIIKINLNLNNESLHLLRNLAAGKGFINLQSAFGGLAFKNISLLTYDFIDFINKEGVIDE